MKTLNEFLLVISPSQTIMDYVSYLKQELKRILGHDYPSVFSTAHITLFPYKEYHTESFLYQVENEVSKWTPFHVYIKGSVSLSTVVIALFTWVLNAKALSAIWPNLGQAG